MRNLTSALNRLQNASNAMVAIDAIQVYLCYYFRIENIYIQKLQGKTENLKEQKEKFLLHGEKIALRIAVLAPENVQNSTMFKNFLASPKLANLVNCI
jgi:hypothetical protein